MTVKPRTPPGILELLPNEQVAFQRMLDTIRHGFERFGFLPVETPAFELSEMLLTKSGGETEKQVYFVQQTGALKEGATPELALRFDLTVPLARYVAQHEPDLAFPFRRYQIQRVYRGERAQRGRYREFYQCDIDVIGKDTLPLAFDAEMPAIIHGIFEQLAFGPFTIKFNNRKLLRGILEVAGIAAEQQTSVLHEVDRLGKQSREDVAARIAAVGIAPEVTERLLESLLADRGDAAAILARLGAIANPPPIFVEGLAELKTVYESTLALGVPAARFAIDLAIVRGLDYYTGTVYETFLDGHESFGSICSGGRYDNLAGLYTKSKLPGVGISIGATRLFARIHEQRKAALAELATLEDKERLARQVALRLPAIADAMLVHLGDDVAADRARLAQELRTRFNIEVYAEDHKLGRQLKYADRLQIPIVVFLDAALVSRGMVKLKDLRGTERVELEVPRNEVVEQLGRLVLQSPV